MRVHLLDTYVCILMDPQEILKIRIADHLKAKMASIFTISRALAEDRELVSKIVSSLAEEGRIKYAGADEISWIERDCKLIISAFCISCDNP